MTTATHSSIQAMREATAPQQFTQLFPPPMQAEQPARRRSDPAQWVVECSGAYPPLELVTKPNLTTGECAYYLNRAPQTLRIWAMRDGTGPIRPRRIGGLLAWSTSEVKALAGVVVNG